MGSVGSVANLGWAEGPASSVNVYPKFPEEPFLFLPPRKPKEMGGAGDSADSARSAVELGGMELTV